MYISLIQKNQTANTEDSSSGFRGRPIPSSRFKTAFFLTQYGNHHGEPSWKGRWQ